MNENEMMGDHLPNSIPVRQPSEETLIEWSCVIGQGNLTSFGWIIPQRLTHTRRVHRYRTFAGPCTSNMALGRSLHACNRLAALQCPQSSWIHLQKRIVSLHVFATSISKYEDAPTISPTPGMRRSQLSVNTFPPCSPELGIFFM